MLRAGNRVRVNSRLIQVSGDLPLWSDRFERDNTVKDMIAIQDEIASAIVNKLRLKLGTGQRRYDTNIDTYNLYLEARAMVGKHGLEGPRAAAELFRQVIAMDPAFAPAYAGLADAYPGCRMFRSRRALLNPRFPLCKRRQRRRWNSINSWLKDMQRWGTCIRAGWTGTTHRSRSGGPSTSIPASPRPTRTTR